jgi:glutamate dehydrogenase (NADP+)
MSSAVATFMDEVIRKNPGQPEFHQAVHELAQSVMPVVERHPELRRARILERMVEPERAVMFRVTWVDDAGEVRVNRGMRVQFNSAIGPYKGGLRFHPSVNLSIIKFLGFEQIFKNSLTTLPMGGGKGGADFDPKGRSDGEVMRFCQAFMTELSRHIGADTDVPAGDIGVGGREIGFMYGQYRKLQNRFDGTLTGKGLTWGGSLIRPEATGYGVVYFAQEMLKTRGEDLPGKRVVISGSGNAAQYGAEKAIQLGAKVLTLSDSTGFIFDPDGIDQEKLAYVMHLKNVKRGRIREYVEKYTKAKYTEVDQRRANNPLWAVPCDVALPSATQNEIDEEDAKALVKNGCVAVSEAANMPSTPAAVKVFLDSKTLYGPAKAANAGGVATSGLEMSQNSTRMAWPREEVERRLRTIMINIHENCRRTAEEFGVPGNYVDGANIAGFRKVASAMLDQGVL